MTRTCCANCKYEFRDHRGTSICRRFPPPFPSVEPLIVLCGEHALDYMKWNKMADDEAQDAG